MCMRAPVCIEEVGYRGTDFMVLPGAHPGR